MTEYDKKLDSRDIAHNNELWVLKAVRHFGHLRKAEIAMAGWPGSPVESAEKMAGRTLARLLEKELVIERHNALSGTSYVLTAKGASLLTNQEALPTSAGYGIQGVAGPQFWHRTLGTSYLLNAMKVSDEAEVYGEYAINRGFAPVSREKLAKHYGKVPDGLIIRVSDGSTGYRKGLLLADWVEVESSFKPPKERLKMLEVAWKVGTFLKGTPQPEEIVFDRMVIVFNQEQNHRNAIIASAHKQLGSQSIELPEVSAITDSVILAAANLGAPLKWKGVSQTSLTSALQEENIRKRTLAGDRNGNTFKSRIATR